MKKSFLATSKFFYYPGYYYGVDLIRCRKQTSPHPDL